MDKYIKGKTLIISGGGIKGFGLLGVLHKLVMDDKLQYSDIKNFIGSSVGGLIVTLICFGYSALDAFLMMFDLLPINYAKEKKKLLDKLNSIIADITFEELFTEKGVTLVLTSFDIVERKAIYYSHMTNPDKRVFDAVSETISIPVLMNSSDPYVDGCLCSPFPILFAKTNNLQNIVGIYCYSNYQKVLTIRNPLDDLKICLGQLSNNLTYYETLFADANDQLYVFNCTVPFEIFDIDESLAKDLFIAGFDTQC
jgi:hypothetical protein